MEKKKEANDSDLWVCIRCGSKKIRILAWIDANTFEFLDNSPDAEGYCDNCEEHRMLIKSKDYNNR
jgi:hypothetical protein